jgi:hypothetical protein
MKNETGYVHYEPSDSLVHVELESGKIDLSVFLCNETDSSSELIYAITSWSEDTESVIIAPHFTVAAPVDYLIDMHQMPSHSNHIDVNAKPIFKALREEMIEQISRIDALVFSSTGISDVKRYRFLRDKFAKNADSDEAEFAKLAHLTGDEFDAAVDAAMGAA